VNAARFSGFIWGVLLALLGALLVGRAHTTQADTVLRPQPSAHSAVGEANASADPPAVSTPRAQGDLGVVLRLIDVLDQAEFEAPLIGRTELALANHWRRMKAPYVGPAGALGRAVQQLGFSSDPERELTKPAVKPSRARPTVIGGVHQRLVIVVPAPSSIRHRFVVPPGALLETEIAVAGPPRSVKFEVAVRTGRGQKVLSARTLEPKDAHRYHELKVGLGEFAGQSVELELKTKGELQSGIPPVALWASPVVLAPGAASIPYNLLWISVDALRPDAIACFHDDATDRRFAEAKPPALDAWLPRLEEVAPKIDALAKESTIFLHAWSASTWTRPGMSALLAGARNSELGLSTTAWVLTQPELARFDASRRSLLPLVLRDRGFHVRAYVNDFFSIGYSEMGVDLGFESLDDYRHDLDDTRLITSSALSFLRGHKGHRFGLFVHYNSPHAPYLPPKALLERIPQPPRGPSHPFVRRYLAEVSKDDAAIGELLAELDRLGLRERTLVVLTADHGETLSAAHDFVVELDGRRQNMRFRHAPSIWEETARVPMLIRFPGRVPAGLRLDFPVQTTDLKPTVLELFGISENRRLSGRSLVPLFRGQRMEEAPVIVEGRASRSIQVGRHRLIEREKNAPVHTQPGNIERLHELYDLQTDAGERNNLIDTEPAVAKRLLTRLKAEVQRARDRGLIAVSSVPGKHPALTRARLAFASGGASEHVTGTLKALDAEGRPAGRLRVQPIGAPAGRVSVDGSVATLDLRTPPDALVEHDLELDGAQSVGWELYRDAKAWPADGVHLGPLGVVAREATNGLADPNLQLTSLSAMLPYIDARAEKGLFVTLEPGAGSFAALGGSSVQANAETMQLLRDWGYIPDERK
jgi:arylsulfatase A-like enzyme